MKKRIKQELEKEIRIAYQGILSEEQIQATILWWNDKLSQFLAEKIKEIEGIEKEIIAKLKSIK